MWKKIYNIWQDLNSGKNIERKKNQKITIIQIHVVDYIAFLEIKKILIHRRYDNWEITTEATVEVT